MFKSSQNMLNCSFLENVKLGWVFLFDIISLIEIHLPPFVRLFTLKFSFVLLDKSQQCLIFGFLHNDSL